MNGPDGQPYVNTAPVSRVRYSHGGHLLAVVTGRLAQVYHMVDLDFDADQAGTPRRIMVITDHTAAITELVFSADDTGIFTSGLDGAVYQYSVGVSTRQGEYIYKGLPISRLVACCHSNDVIAYVEPAIDVVAVNRSKTFRRTSVASVESDGGKAKRKRTYAALSGHPLAPSSLSKPSKPGKSPAQASAESRVGLVANTMRGNSETDEGNEFKDENEKRAVSASTGASRGGRDAYTGHTVSATGVGNFLSVWRNGRIDEHVQSVLLDFKLTALEVGRIIMSENNSKHDLVIMGCSDGKIILSVLPFPLVSISVDSGLGTRLRTPAAAPEQLTVRPTDGVTVRPTDGVALGRRTPASRPTTGGGGGGAGGVISLVSDGTNLSAGVEEATRASAEENEILIFNISSNGAGGGESSSVKVHHEGMLNLAQCKQFSCHSGAVTTICISKSGLWITTGIRKLIIVLLLSHFDILTLTWDCCRW